MADTEKVEKITPPSTLKAKVGTGGPGAVSPEVLERAEKVISDLAESYVEWAREDMANLTAAFDDLAAAAEGSRKEHLERIFHIAHDMKGQGGSFDYNLITVIGHGLCRFIEGREDVGPAGIEAIQLHIESMRVVLAKEIKGEGGSVGDQLLDGLELVVAKVSEESKFTARG